MRRSVKELISPSAERLTTAFVDQTRLGPRTMARLEGVILFTSWFSATFRERGGWKEREEEREGGGRGGRRGGRRGREEREGEEGGRGREGEEREGGEGGRRGREGGGEREEREERVEE